MSGAGENTVDPARILSYNKLRDERKLVNI